MDSILAVLIDVVINYFVAPGTVEADAVPVFFYVVTFYGIAS